ncbi:hypothetical protein [Streptomyces sp. NPDC048659]|uniref:hypothetical protein n=1 Tax=Streptomyces sp. NPDC048659 TaxID=3155489 RepID=UPI00343EF0D4
METHVHVPVRIVLTGEPGPDELAALTGRLTALVARRLDRAARETARRRPAGPAPAAAGAAIREAHEPDRDVPGGYALPSYAGAGRRTAVPSRGEPPWTVVGTARARIEVGRYLRYVAEVLGREFPEAALYRSLGGQVRDADVWLVRLGHAHAPHALGEELVTASSAREHGGATVPAWAVAGTAASLRRLTDADTGGAVAARIPRVPPRHVVFTTMRLPRVALGDVAALGPGLVTALTVPDTGFCVDPFVFERATGLPWSRYAEEYARETIHVRIQPAVLRAASTPVRTPAGIQRDALFLLFDRHAGPGPAHHEPAARLLLADGDAFPEVPAAALRGLEWPDEEGERVLYCRASLDLGPDRLDAARFRPAARRIAAGILPLIGDPAFGEALRALLDETARHAPGRTGGLFGHVLDDLAGHGALAAFLDAADSTGRFALRLELLRQCETTPYAGHDRVRALRAALTGERAATTAHTYTPGGPGQGALRLDRRPDGTVPAGGLLGAVDLLYEKTTTVLRPKPGRAEALRAALLAQRLLLVEAVLTGSDPREYTEEEFAAEAAARAARAAGITADDFEEIRVALGIRLLEVLATEEGGLPSYAVRFELVSRAADRAEPWTRAAGPLLEPVGLFEARLVEWRLGQAGTAYRWAGFAVVAVGGAALAWEAGVVASLLRLGGGARAVGVGVGLSETLHLVRVLLHEEDGVGGFATAAVDGYLGSVGFRIGGGLGGLAAGRFGTAGLRARIASWLAGKLVTGAVGGASSAALAALAHDVVDARWSGVEAYARTMEFGTVVGVIGAFTVEPLLHALLTRAAPTLVKAALLTRLLSAEGVTAERWAEAMALTRRRMEHTLGQGLPAAEARAWAQALASRADEAAEGLAHASPGARGTAARISGRVEPGVGAGAGGALPPGAGPGAGGALAYGPESASGPVESGPSASAPGSVAGLRSASGRAAFAPGSMAGLRSASGRAASAPVAASDPVAVPLPVPADAAEAASARSGPAAAWPGWAQLKRASLTDREAALDRWWYERARPEELRAREARDPVAKEFLDEAWGGARRPHQPERPGDPAVQDLLRGDLAAARAAVEAERLRQVAAGLRAPSARERAGFQERATPAGAQEVPPTAKAAAGYEGTVAVARSDIPALAGELFTGGSPRALGSYAPGHPVRPPDEVVVPQAHGHAEQDLGQRLDTRLARLTDAERAAARGRTVFIRVDQEVCSICAAALGGGPRAGVLARLSARHPDIVFEVTADDVSTVYRIVGGRRVR